MSDPRGVVTLVGAGPGDPGLLTLHAVAALRAADVVLFDALVDPRILEHLRPDAERISVGKRSGHCVMTQGEIHEELVRHARLGRCVVRLKGGDPFVFGRGAEEVETLRAAGITSKVIPGVTAGVGATSYAGIPVTHREIASAVAFVTGHDDPAAETCRIDWEALASFPGTLVVYMGVSRLAAIRDRLMESGKSGDTPAAFVQNGSLPGQRVIVAALRHLPEIVQREGGVAPALIVIGEVVNRRPGLNWFENLPLFGQRILVTRPHAEGVQAIAGLQAMGAEAILAPMIDIQPLDDPTPIDRAIERMATFDWVVFTSSNGVRGLMKRIEAAGADSRVFGTVKIASIGPSTAETLASYHLRADLVAESYVSESLAAGLAGKAGGARVLLIQADRGRATLGEALRKVAHVERVATYENRDIASLDDEVARRLVDGSIDWITVTSGAIATRLHALMPETVRERVGSSIRLASLSPLTTSALSRLGWKVDVEAGSATWESLVEAIGTFVTAVRGHDPHPLR